MSGPIQRSLLESLRTAKVGVSVPGCSGDVISGRRQVALGALGGGSGPGSSPAAPLQPAQFGTLPACGTVSISTYFSGQGRSLEVTDAVPL